MLNIDKLIIIYIILNNQLINKLLVSFYVTQSLIKSCLDLLGPGSTYE